MNLRLAKKNKEVSPKSWKNLREKAIVAQIRQGKNEYIKPRSQNEELALLRKAVKCLFDIVKTLHYEEIKNNDFIQYYNDVEYIINEVDSNFQI